MFVVVPERSAVAATITVLERCCMQCDVRRVPDLGIAASSRRSRPDRVSGLRMYAPRRSLQLCRMARGAAVILSGPMLGAVCVGRFYRSVGVPTLPEPRGTADPRVRAGARSSDHHRKLDVQGRRWTRRPRRRTSPLTPSSTSLHVAAWARSRTGPRARSTVESRTTCRFAAVNLNASGRRSGRRRRSRGRGSRRH